MSKTIAYIRASTDKQDLNNQGTTENRVKLYAKDEENTKIIYLSDCANQQIQYCIVANYAGIIYAPLRQLWIRKQKHQI